jgi:hypothetical protein
MSSTFTLDPTARSIGGIGRCVEMKNRIEVRRAWRFSGRYRVLPIEPGWLGGSEYIIIEKLEDGSLLLRPALGVKTDSDAIRLEVLLNGGA